MCLWPRQPVNNDNVVLSMGYLKKWWGATIDPWLLQDHWVPSLGTAWGSQGLISSFSISEIVENVTGSRVGSMQVTGDRAYLRCGPLSLLAASLTSAGQPTPSRKQITPGGSQRQDHQTQMGSSPRGKEQKKAAISATVRARGGLTRYPQQHRVAQMHPLGITFASFHFVLSCNRVLPILSFTYYVFLKSSHGFPK